MFDLNRKGGVMKKKSFISILAAFLGFLLPQTMQTMAQEQPKNLADALAKLNTRIGGFVAFYTGGKSILTVNYDSAAVREAIKLLEFRLKGLSDEIDRVGSKKVKEYMKSAEKIYIGMISDVENFFEENIKKKLKEKGEKDEKEISCDTTSVIENDIRISELLGIKCLKLQEIDPGNIVKLVKKISSLEKDSPRKKLNEILEGTAPRKYSDFLSRAKSMFSSAPSSSMTNSEYVFQFVNTQARVLYEDIILGADKLLEELQKDEAASTEKKEGRGKKIKEAREEIKKYVEEVNTSREKVRAEQQSEYKKSQEKR